MSESSRTLPNAWPLRRAIGLAAAAGIVGWAQNGVTRHYGWRFPSGGSLAGELVWNLATIGIAAWALWHYDGLRLNLRTAGFRPTKSRSDRAPFPWFAALAVVAIAMALSALVGDAATSGASYGSKHQVAFAVLIGELLVRYPLTVFAEEALFRGVLQPRLGRYGPVLAALCWGGYHLQQASTIPQLIAFGIGLGFMRWWTGNVRATAIAHYLGDAVFLILTYT
ncbi:MAG: lysostaphin resistance A-like protein [Microthrixaceae bacterium]